jgi:RNA polymerase sigma-70 factor (ECF subfamily)
MSEAPQTQPSLLLRLRDAQDDRAWAEFVELYVPIIQGFIRKYGLQTADADDLTQEVLRLVLQALKRLEYDPRLGSFRGWLYTVVRNQVRNFLARQRPYHCGIGGTTVQQLLEGQQIPEADEEAAWNAEFEQRLFAHAANQVRNDFQDTTWQAFWLTGVEGKAAKEVAAQLGLSVAAVYLARGRVMIRLKEQIRFLQGE